VAQPDLAGDASKPKLQGHKATPHKRKELLWSAAEKALKKLNERLSSQRGKCLSVRARYLDGIKSVVVLGKE